MKKLIATLAAAVVIGTLSSAAAAHGPEYRDGHRLVARAHHHERAHYRRDQRRAHRRAYRHHRELDRRWQRRQRVLRHPHGHRCRIDHRHYHRGIAYYGDLEAVVLGAVAYGIVREVLD